MADLTRPTVEELALVAKVLYGWGIEVGGAAGTKWNPYDSDADAMAVLRKLMENDPHWVPVRLPGSKTYMMKHNKRGQTEGFPELRHAVRPEHLFAGTMKENMQDAVRKRLVGKAHRTSVSHLAKPTVRRGSWDQSAPLVTGSKPTRSSSGRWARRGDDSPYIC